MSWKCPGHVLGTGTCPKIPGTESDGRPFFWIFCSVTCPQHVLGVSHVSNTLKNTKKKRTQINLIFRMCDWMIIRFHCKIFYCNFAFAITKQLLIPKKKKMEVTTKDLLRKTLWSKSLLSPPLYPSWSRIKLFFFILSFFINYWSHKIKLLEMVRQFFKIQFLI